MAAPKGNRYGVDSGNFFKPKAYTPEEWAKVFIDYLEDRQEKVWNKKEAIKGGDMAGTIIDIPTSLPLTIESFCVFAGVTKSTFYNYEKKEGYQEYFDITTRIREIIESDQTDGAMIGAYNPNIIARKLGLSEKVQNENRNINYNSAELSKEEIKKMDEHFNEEY